MQKTLSDYQLIILNTYYEDRRKFSKNKGFLKDKKKPNPQWLYLYYTQSTQKVDEIRRLVMRESQNKKIFNITTKDTPFDQTVEPFVFF